MYKINTRVNYQQKFGIPVPNIEKFKDPSISQWMGTSTKLQRWRVDKRYRNCEVLIHCCRNRFDLREMLQEEREIYCKLKTINAKETKERGKDNKRVPHRAALAPGLLTSIVIDNDQLQHQMRWRKSGSSKGSRTCHLWLRPQITL